jgi:hypothetical protein
MERLACIQDPAHEVDADIVIETYMLVRELPWIAISRLFPAEPAFPCDCRAYLHAVVCGFLTPRGEVRLNPTDTEVLEPGSKLVLLGKGGKLFGNKKCRSWLLNADIALKNTVINKRCSFTAYVQESMLLWTT